MKKRSSLIFKFVLSLFAGAAVAFCQEDVNPRGALYVPGQFQGWDPVKAPALQLVEGTGDKYDGYIYMQGDGPQFFKITSSRDWDHLNYGDAGSGRLSIEGQANGLSVPESGYYFFNVDLAGYTWSATKVAWGVVGSATSGGWERDTPMAYDSKKKVWEVVIYLKTGASFKFRANGQWLLNFGLDGEGRLKYANHPILGYDSTVKDFVVSEDGIYVVTLDIDSPGNYSYAVRRVSLR